MGTNVTALSPALPEPGQRDGPAGFSGVEHRPARAPGSSGGRSADAHLIQRHRPARFVYFDCEENPRRVEDRPRSYVGRRMMAAPADFLDRLATGWSRPSGLHLASKRGRL